MTPETTLSDWREAGDDVNCTSVGCGTFRGFAAIGRDRATRARALDGSRIGQNGGDGTIEPVYAGRISRQDPKTHRWGKRISPQPPQPRASAIHGCSPLHMSVELLPLRLFTKPRDDRQTHQPRGGVDSRRQGEQRDVADRRRRGSGAACRTGPIDEGKSWNVTATEREALVENIAGRWTSTCVPGRCRRFNINAMAVNEINNRARHKGPSRDNSGDSAMSTINNGGPAFPMPASHPHLCRRGG